MGRIVTGRKPGLRDFEGAIGPIANQIEARGEAVVIVTKQRCVLAAPEQAPMRRGVLDDFDASRVEPGVVVS